MTGPEQLSVVEPFGSEMQGELQFTNIYNHGSCHRVAEWQLLAGTQGKVVRCHRTRFVRVGMEQPERTNCPPSSLGAERCLGSVQLWDGGVSQHTNYFA